MRLHWEQGYRSRICQERSVPVSAVLGVRRGVCGCARGGAYRSRLREGWVYRLQTCASSRRDNSCRSSRARSRRSVVFSAAVYKFYSGLTGASSFTQTSARTRLSVSASRHFGSNMHTTPFVLNRIRNARMARRITRRAQTRLPGLLYTLPQKSKLRKVGLMTGWRKNL